MIEEDEEEARASKVKKKNRQEVKNKNVKFGKRREENKLICYDGIEKMLEKNINCDFLKKNKWWILFSIFFSEY